MCTLSGTHAGKDVELINVNSYAGEGKCSPFLLGFKCVSFTLAVIIPALLFVHMLHTIAKQKDWELETWDLESVI